MCMYRVSDSYLITYAAIVMRLAYAQKCQLIVFWRTTQYGNWKWTTKIVRNCQLYKQRLMMDF